MSPPTTSADATGPAGSLARIDALCPFELRLGVPPGPGWLRAEALCDTAVFAALRTHVRASEKVLRGNLGACVAGAFVHVAQPLEAQAA